MAPRQTRFTTAALVVAASTAIGVLLVEGGLRLVLEPGDFMYPAVIEEAALGVRVKPGGSGHDALGFRNAALPPRGAIIALGDSQTHGVNANRQGAWPAQLGAALGEPVYNMGMAGFGPLQYLELARTQARELQPRLLLTGLYLGNDVMDAYYVAKDRPYWQAWRRTSEAAGAATPFHQARTAEPQRAFEGLRTWLSDHSMLYSVLKATVLTRLAAAERMQLAKTVSRDIQMPWTDPQHPSVRTIFTPAYRLGAMDDTIPSVRDGTEITRDVLRALRDKARRQNAGLLVVLIPTKEGVYCERLQRTGADLPAAYRRLCDAEQGLRTALSGFMAAESIAHVDVQPALARAAHQGQLLYPEDGDGHPRAAGYAVIAQAVAQAIRRSGP